jgi:hypothetical protein
LTRLPSGTAINEVAIVVAVVNVVGEIGVDGNGVAMGADRVASGLGITAAGAGRVAVGEAATGNAATEGDTSSGSACTSRSGFHPIAIVRKRAKPTKVSRLLTFIGVIRVLAVHNVSDVISLFVELLNNRRYHTTVEEGAHRPQDRFRLVQKDRLRDGLCYVG